MKPLLLARVLLLLATVSAFPLTPSPESLAPSTARDFPPAVPPPSPMVLPSPSVRVLPNGLKVVVIGRHSLPLVTVRLVVKAGAEADPPELAGTAQLVAALLEEGTTRRSAQQIAEAIDQVGGTIETGAEWDNSFAALSVLTDHTELAFDLLADMTIRPAFAPAEFERKRQQTLSALEVLREDPSYLADTVFSRMVFTGTPYGHPVDGTVETLRRMTAQNLREFHARYYRPSSCILALLGDISADEAFGRAEKFFGVWKDRPVPAPPSPTTTGASMGSRGVVVIDKPDAVQTEIRIGSPGIPRDSPDYYAVTVANQILGGPATNRLFKALRSQHGLTYGASSDVVCHRILGSWVAKTSTRTPETIKSAQMVLEQIKHLRDHPISDNELKTAQAYLIGHLALEFETSDGIATQVLELLIHNLPLDYWDQFPAKIQGLGREDVWSATRRYLDPERAVIVLVGNAAGFGKDLKKLGRVRMIPVSGVDLASANLERASGAAGNR